jgi:hypothetical protein
VLGGTRKYEPRSYLADPFEVVLTCTNLRGVPYKLALEDGDYDSLSHADFLQFHMGEAAPTWGASRRLGAEEAPWRDLFNDALASSAFPAGLSARRVSRERKDYAERTWEVMVTQNGVDFRAEQRTLTPAWRS